MTDKMSEAEEREAQIEDDLAPLHDEEALRRRVTRQVKKRREFMAHLGTYLAINLLLLGLFLALGIPWVAGVVALSWGSGLAAHGLDTYYQTGKRAAIRTARIHQAFRDQYGPRWYDDATERQLRATLKQVEEPHTKRREFLQHAVVFALINAMLFFIYFTTGANGGIDGFPWPLMVTGFWGFGLVSHGLGAFAGRRNANAVEREMERQRALLEEAQWGSGEKPKRLYDEPDDSPGMTLGPDGELIEVDPRPRRKRS